MTIRYFCYCLLLTAVVSLAPAYGDTNLLENPGFENGTAGWAGRSCAIESAGDPVHGGTGSARVYDRKEAWQGIKQSVLGKMQDGTTYQISAWVRLENADSNTVTVSVEQADDDGTSYLNVASTMATKGEWVHLSGEFTLYVSGTLKVLDVYFEGPGAGVNFFVDDVEVMGPPAAEQTEPADPNASKEEM